MDEQPCTFIFYYILKGIKYFVKFFFTRCHLKFKSALIFRDLKFKSALKSPSTFVAKVVRGKDILKPSSSNVDTVVNSGYEELSKHLWIM